MCTRRMPVDICVKIAIPATRDHLPRGDTLALNRQCPLVAGTTVAHLRRFEMCGISKFATLLKLWRSLLCSDFNFAQKIVEKFMRF